MNLHSLPATLGAMNGKLTLPDARGAESILDWILANFDRLAIGALIAAAIIAVMLGLRWIGQRWAEGDPDSRRWRGIVGRALARTSIWFMAAAAVDIVASYATLPAKLSRLADILFIIASTLQAAIWAREVIIGVIRSRVGDDPGASTLGNAMGIVRVLVSVALFAVALIVILDNLGVNVTALVAGLGIGGIAIGLAAQGIFSDLFAALSIVFDRPFRRGDLIRYGGVPGTIGTVERIGLKSTRIRSISGEHVVMANTKLLEQELTNVALAQGRRIWLPFGIVYQTAPDVIESLPQLMESVLKPLKTCKVVRCCAAAFGASSIDCELVYDDRSTEPDTLAKHKSAIIIGIMKAFSERGIEFAYPTQTTFTAAPDGRMIMPYARIQPVAPIEPDDGK